MGPEPERPGVHSPEQQPLCPPVVDSTAASCSGTHASGGAAVLSDGELPPTAGRGRHADAADPHQSAAVEAHALTQAVPSAKTLRSGHVALSPFFPPPFFLSSSLALHPRFALLLTASAVRVLFVQHLMCGALVQRDAAVC